jgi:hypothetical protein
VARPATEAREGGLRGRFRSARGGRDKGSNLCIIANSGFGARLGISQFSLRNSDYAAWCVTGRSWTVIRGVACLHVENRSTAWETG